MNKTVCSMYDSCQYQYQYAVRSYAVSIMQYMTC